jgi:hypothetical protein
MEWHSEAKLPKAAWSFKELLNEVFMPMSAYEASTAPKSQTSSDFAAEAKWMQTQQKAT